MVRTPVQYKFKDLFGISVLLVFMTILVLFFTVNNENLKVGKLTFSLFRRLFGRDFGRLFVPTGRRFGGTAGRLRREAIFTEHLAVGGVYLRYILLLNLFIGQRGA
jgi:hypothetical protein